MILVASSNIHGSMIVCALRAFRIIAMASVLHAFCTHIEAHITLIYTFLLDPFHITIKNYSSMQYLMHFNT